MKHYCFVSILIVFLLCAGCTHVSQNPDYLVPRLTEPHMLAPFEFEKKPILTTESSVAMADNYQVVRVDFNSKTGPGPDWAPFHADYYKLNKAGRHPVILLLPILKGKEKVIESFARFFTRNGYAAIIVQRQKSFKSLKTFEGVNTILHQAVINHKVVLDWLEKRPEIDTNNIGALGLSMGGIKTTLLSAVDKRIKAGVLVIAAGDIPWILMHTRENGLIRKRKAHLEKFNMLPKQLFARLKSEITFDPMKYAPYINSKKTLMVLARFDRIAPFSKGLELRTAIGNPETIILPTGHFTAVLFKKYVMKKSLVFFNRHFK